MVILISLLEVFKHFKMEVEDATDRKIKAFHSDREGEYKSDLFHSNREGEYKSDLFQKFCKENGIIHLISMPHTPEQNGIAER